MNNIDIKNINRSARGQGLVFVFCTLFCLIGLLCIPRIKVFAADNTTDDNDVVDAVYDWAAFVPDSDKIDVNPSLKAYCRANGIDSSDFTSDDSLKYSDSDTVDRSNGRFVGNYKLYFKAYECGGGLGQAFIGNFVREGPPQIIMIINVRLPGFLY